jgi:drug/metabolite transporter (DMT)-like permease
LRVEYVCIVLVALTWGGYPVIARSSGVGTPLGALILTVSALLPIAIATIWNGVVVRPTSIELAKLMVAGVLMGTGTTAFNFVTNSRRIEASLSIPIMDTAMMLVTVVAAIVFFAEPVTIKKVVGLLLLVAGIVVLKPE